MRARFLAVAFALTLTFAACGGDDTPEATPTAAITATRTIAVPAATATAAATATIAPAPTAPPAGTPPVLRSLPPAPSGSITVGAVGDVSLAREVVEHMAANGAGYPYALIAPALSSDIVFANLEGALTDRGEPWPKGYNFRTPPAFAPGLRDAGFDIVSLANNHTLDYGVIGIPETFFIGADDIRCALQFAGFSHQRLRQERRNRAR